MSKGLFSFNDVDGEVARVKVESFAEIDTIEDAVTILSGEKDTVSSLLPLPLLPNVLYSCLSNGMWDHYHLVDHILKQTGEGSEIHLATWSISELSARQLVDWIAKGRVSKVQGVLDYRSKNRHPAAFHLAKNIFSDIKIDYCHAKVTVIRSADHSHNICICGSANWTQNPRKEACTILNSKKISDTHIQWISQVIKKGKYGLDD